MVYQEIPLAIPCPSEKLDIFLVIHKKISIECLKIVQREALTEIYFIFK